MRKQWVIPDIHGCVKTLRTLVEEQIRPARYDELYFLGDYIDRGPDSKGVIDYIRKLQQDEFTIIPLKGNHEDFVISLYEDEMKSAGSWFRLFPGNKRKAWVEVGGKETLKSFGIQTVKEIPPEYIEWMKGLKHFVELDKFILVHAGLNFKLDNPFEDQRSMLWVRDFEIDPSKIGNRKVIHGHVPVNMELIVQSIKNSYFKFIDLDNGPYIFERDGFGCLVALELNSMELVIQDNRDT